MQKKKISRDPDTMAPERESKHSSSADFVLPFSKDVTTSFQAQQCDVRKINLANNGRLRLQKLE